MRDTELLQRITATLGASGKTNIKVGVKGGFVTLRGPVQTFRQKERLHQFVMHLPGVRALKDLLKVEPQESVSDGKASLHIRQALDSHSELPAGTAVVSVCKGVATLKGNVRSPEERFIAENVTSHCRGVKSVINKLTVDVLEEISDEAAARAVRCALAYCEEFETEGITVSCADGDVVLRGAVPTLMDRRMAEEVARVQAGVRHVENHIDVLKNSGVVKIRAARKRAGAGRATP